MTPYDAYRLYQIERRGRNPAEMRRADEQAGRLAFAISSLFRTGRSRERSAYDPLTSDTAGASVRECRPAWQDTVELAA